MPELSIIIPVADEFETFENTLVSVLENRPSDCEVIVVRDERYTDPYSIGDEVTFVEASREVGLVERIALGVGASRAELVHTLGSGVQVTERWTESALTHFHRPRVGAVVPLVVDQCRPRRTVAAGATLTAGGRRQLERRLPRNTASAHETERAATLTAAFFRKSAYQLVGGLDPVVGNVLADVDLAARLRHAGYLTVIEPEAILTHAGPLRDAIASDGRCEERLFLRNAPTFGWGPALGKHPLAIAWRLLARPLPWQVARDLGGRLAAWAEIGRMREHHRKLASICGLATTMGEPVSVSNAAAVATSAPEEELPHDAVLTIESHRPSNRRLPSGHSRHCRAA
ncbi:MAG: glycosyltransferase [Planctomycetales bacterium]|nr:glycosyltransferase [Planctomycetales bacterium]